jgi:hypothetical protein
MPSNFNILHCNKNSNSQNIVGCKYTARAVETSIFKPTHSPVIHTFKDKPVETKQISKALPFSPLPTSIDPLPNNNAYHYVNNISAELSATDGADKKNKKTQINTKFTFFSEKLRQEHLNFVKSFEDHPNFKPIDKIAAQLSSAAYLEDTTAMHEYLTELTDLNEKGWELHKDPKTHSEWQKTFRNKNTGDIIIASKGTVSWLKDDGIANISNTIGTTKFRQQLNDNLDVDIRLRKARIIDNTNTYINENYGGKVKLLTGHSQAGFDAVQAQKSHFTNAEITTFNPAPSGTPLKHLGKSFVTPNDVVSLSNKFKAIVNPNQYKVHTVRSIDTSIVNRLTGGHSITNFAATNPPNTVISEHTPLLSHTEHTNLPVKFSGIKNFGRGIAVGIPAIGASLLVDKIAPDQNEHVKTAEVAVSTAVGTKLVSSAVGATSVVASEAIIPLFTSFEAAAATGKAVDAALEDTNLTTVEKSTISGAASGTVGAGVFSGTAAAQQAAVNLGRAALTTSTVGEEGVGLIAAGEAAEAALLAAETAEAVVVGAEVAVAAVEVAEVATVGSAALAGATAGSFLAPESFGLSILIGAGLGAIGGIIGGVFAENANKEAVEAKEAAAEIARQEWFDAQEVIGAGVWADTQQRWKDEAAVKNAATWKGQHKFASTTFQKQEPIEPVVAETKPIGVQKTAT